MDRGILDLIEAYLADVKAFTSALEKQINGVNPLKAVKSKLIKKEGQIGDFKYSFHGKGCEVRMQNKIIDFDYGSNFRSDVFDLWRLSLYAESRKSDFPNYSSIEALQKDFAKLLDNGVIKKDNYKYEDLYYISNPRSSESTEG